MVGYAENSKILHSKINGLVADGYNAAAVVCEAINTEIEDVSISDTSVSAENLAGTVAAISKNSTMKGIKVGGT